MINVADVSDLEIDMALGMSRDFLDPAAEQEAVTFILRELRPDLPELTEDRPLNPTVLSLSDGQLDRFRSDLNAPTPQKYPKASQHRLSRFALLQLIIASRFGKPYGLEDLRDGVVVQDIYPSVAYEHRESSSFGSREPFKFHTDQAYNQDSSLVPDFVLLSCIRNPELAATRVSSATKALEEISEIHRDLLAQNLFFFHRGRPEENTGKRSGPIVASPQGHIRLGTDMTFQSEEAMSSYMAFVESLEKHSTSVILKPGQILINPNLYFPHSRDAFVPSSRIDSRRWLQRIDVSTQQ